MEQPERFFERINTYKDLENLIGEECESLYVEFKTVNDSGLKKNGDNAKNFAKALSGFANSAGGVLIWGISDRKEGELRDGESVEIAEKLVPFKDFKRFEAELSKKAAEWVFPGIDGFIAKSIPSEDDPEKGIVLALIPKSEKTPHFNQREHRYYARSGSSFCVMEHYQIDDMFGRRPKPKLECKLKVEKTKHADNEYRCSVVVTNIGKGSAHYPACRVKMKYCSFMRDEDVNLKTSLKSGTDILFYSDFNNVIHPGMEKRLAYFLINADYCGEFRINVYSDNIHNVKKAFGCAFKEGHNIFNKNGIPRFFEDYPAVYDIEDE